MNKNHYSNEVISKILVLVLVITGVFASTSIGTFASTKTVGNAESYAELKELLENDDIETINITKSFNLDNSQNTTHKGITLERSVTINGNNHTITGNQMGYLIYAKSDANNENTEVNISDLTFKDFQNTGMNGKKWASDSWGGVLKLYCNATITNCHFENNATTLSKVGDNSNYGNGGAIMHARPDFAASGYDEYPNYNTLLTIKDCTFTGNSAAKSGGAIFSNESVVIENSTFKNNESHRDGGSVFISKSGTIKDCVFTGNQVYKPENEVDDNGNAIDIPAQGGAIYFSGSSEDDNLEYDNGISINDCNFFNNTSETSGGAIFAENDLVYNGNNNFFENTSSDTSDLLGIYLFHNEFVAHDLVAGEAGSSLNVVEGTLKPTSITNENTTLTVSPGKTESMDVATESNPSPIFTAEMENGSSLPGWIKVNKNTGKITASPGRTQKAGNTTITVSATNGVPSEGGSEPKVATKNFTIEVLALSQYIVTLDVNGGNKLANDRIAVIDGEKYGALPSPVRKGYSFNGWYTQESGGTIITDDTIVNITNNQTLYARWSPNKYKVTFVGNKGKVSNKTKVTKKKTYDKKFGKLPKAKRKGYKFKGWYTKKKGGKKITSKTKMTYAKNMKLYARWKKK